MMIPNYVGQIQAAAPLLIMAISLAAVLLVAENYWPKKGRF